MRGIDINITGRGPKTRLLEARLKLLRLLRERWKGISVSIILVVATIGFTQIAVTGGTRQNVLESFYQAVRLFVLGADGTPAEGAVTWIVIMWCAYFLAPALTATFLVESISAIRQAVVNPDRVVRKMNNHLILCGLGKHGKLIVERVRARDAKQGVVIVDRDSSLPSSFELAAGGKVPVIAGDMTDALTLRRAGIERSRRLYAASGNDVANLNTCLLALAKEWKHTADFRAVALVSDVDLSRGVSELARREGVVLINPYEIAARNLAMQISTTKESPDMSDSVVVVAGFGRFGQMLAKALIERAGETVSLALVVVDRIATKKVEAFRRNFHISNLAIVAIDGDIDDPRVFETALADSDSTMSTAKRTVVLCTDNDTANLNTALLLEEHWGVHATVLTRLFNPPPRFRELIDGSRIRTFQIPELIEEGLPAECF